jgi:glycosyltransferase involved in cell wall biosynthesis
MTGMSERENGQTTCAPLKENITVGIDGRMHGHSGIGRYITMLLEHLPRTAGSGRQYAVFSSERFFDGPFRHVKTRSRPLSLFEQFDLPVRRLGVHLDLFHSPQFNIPLFSGTPQITTIHDCAYSMFPEEFSSLLDRCLYTIMFRLALMKSSRIIAVSQATKDDLRNIYGIRAEKIRVVHEGVESDFFETPDDTAGSRGACGVDGPFLLFVGIPRPRKNLERILRAFAATRGRIDRKIKLVIAGPEDSRFLNIRHLAAKLNIAKSIVLTGHMTDHQLRSLYRSARCLLFPTLYEGFGLPILEGMASGVPVITSSRPAHVEIAGDAALFVNPLDVDEIAEAVVRITEDVALRGELSEKGLKRAHMFSWETCAAQTLAVYDNVING